MSDENAAVGNDLDGIETESSTTVEAPVAAKPEPAPEHEDGDDDHSEKKKSGWARQRDRLRSENETLKAQLAQFQQPKPEQQAKPEAKAEGRPQEKDFDNYIDFFKADNAWLVKQEIAADRKAQKDEADATAKTKAHEEKVTSYNERVQPILEQVPDFPDRVQDLIDQGLVTKSVEDAVLDSPKGELVTLYLLANPQELVSMRGLSEAQTYRAIALIEAKIGDPKSEQSTVAAKKTTAAAPINPVGKKASTSTKAIEDMSQQEFDAYVAKVTPQRR